MKTDLTNAELNALANMVLNRMHEDFAKDCDCPLHRLSQEERTARIDAAIEKTTQQLTKGDQE
jgi:hypothetical protein